MKDDQALLIDIVEHARQLRAAMNGLARDAFDANILVRMGVAHLLQIIGEASRQVTQPTRDRFPTLPWAQIVGMRHRIVHEYFRINFGLVWDTATISIPELLGALEPELGPIIDAAKPQDEC